MLREIDEKLITPAALLTSSDMARLGCNHCEGCSDCCRDRAEVITLDAYDIRLLKEGLNLSFEGLLGQGLITLEVIDRAILPCLSWKESEEECIFLTENGTCSVHAFRPGICRMFPLARLYHEDGSFSYFLQEGECSHANGVKIRISKWLGYPNIKEYEYAVREYHDALTQLRQKTKSGLSSGEQTALVRKFLTDWFINDQP